MSKVVEIQFGKFRQVILDVEQKMENLMKINFAEKAKLPQVKMIEIKLSQGAKPGHGGMLLGAKVSPEIAETRNVPVFKDVISPHKHSEFSTPGELLKFADRLRKLSGGKPVGIKLCIGHPWEFISIVKAMVQTDIQLDFITVDGSEGGTGAAPVEFTDHLGSPLRDALYLLIMPLLAQACVIVSKSRHQVKL